MNRSKPSLGPIASHMEDVLEREGKTPRGLGWRSEENQALRFTQLARLLEGDQEPFTVNDLGCGFADLYGFLKSRSFPMAFYRGYDVSERMLDVARERIGTDSDLVRSDHVTHDADYSFACGIFHTRLEEDESVWLEYMKATIWGLYERSTKGCAFNSLSTYVDWRDEGHFYADPGELFRFCKEELSPRVALLHDYPLYEWAMLVRRVDDTDRY